MDERNEKSSRDESIGANAGSVSWVGMLRCAVSRFAPHRCAQHDKSSSTAYIARIETARDRGVGGAFDDGAAVVVIFSEVLPKTAAFIAPDRVALLVARPMQWVVRLLGPVLMGIE